MTEDSFAHGRGVREEDVLIESSREPAVDFKERWRDWRGPSKQYPPRGGFVVLSSPRACHPPLSSRSSELLNRPLIDGV